MLCAGVGKSFGAALHVSMLLVQGKTVIYENAAPEALEWFCLKLGGRRPLHQVHALLTALQRSLLSLPSLHIRLDVFGAAACGPDADICCLR